MGAIFDKQFDLIVLPDNEYQWAGSFSMLIEAVKQDPSFTKDNSCFEELYKSIGSAGDIVKFILDKTDKFEVGDEILFAKDNGNTAGLSLRREWKASGRKSFVKFWVDGDRSTIDFGINELDGTAGSYCYVETYFEYVDFYKNGCRRKEYLNKWDNDGPKYYNPDGSRIFLGGLRELIRTLQTDNSDHSR